MKLSLKKMTMFGMLVVLLTIGLSFTACSNHITFEVVPITPSLQREVSTNVYLPLISNITSRAELYTFYDEQFIESIVIDDVIEFQVFDDEFFVDKSLLLICYCGNANMNVTIEDISLRGQELFVVFDADKISALTHYTYLFVSVNKTEIANVNKFSYVIKS